MKKNTVLFVIISFLLVFYGLYASDGENPHCGNCFMRALDLTEEQQSRISEMKLRLQRDITPLKAEIHKLRADLKLVLTAEKFDAETLKRLNGEIRKLQEEIKLKHLMHQRAVRDLLTAEQKKKFDLHILSGKKVKGKVGAQRCVRPARLKKLTPPRPAKEPAN